MDALLSINGLAYEAGGRRILDGLSLDIAPGEVHALLGTNGTGKSTLAFIMMGLSGYAPTAGAIRFAGREISASMPIHERARLGITLAWQEPVRFEGITVEAYLGISGRRAGSPAKALALVGLDPERYLARMVDRTLSGGERKRIELAAVYAQGPRLAILDEPDSGIDMLSLGDVKRVISAFGEGDSSALVITHREEIALMADAASHLCFGRIVCTGTPSRVAEYYKERRCLSCMSKECEHV